MLESIKGDSYIELDLTDKTKMQSQLLPLFACSKSQESLPGSRMGELETLTLPREHQVREGPERAGRCPKPQSKLRDADESGNEASACFTWTA